MLPYHKITSKFLNIKTPSLFGIKISDYLGYYLWSHMILVQILISHLITSYYCTLYLTLPDLRFLMCKIKIIISVYFIEL